MINPMQVAFYSHLYINLQSAIDKNITQDSRGNDMKIKMNKIVEESVKGCFCHFDNCGHLYLGRHQNDGLSFTIIDELGDIRVILRC
ncbi:hypothetical protein KHU1_3361 [Bacillus amyloliquefaciens KHG19]|nr:hypothetical protein KHU1_3361 [Bacillus amyloliquefaciens KHG19]